MSIDRCLGFEQVVFDVGPLRITREREEQIRPSVMTHVRHSALNVPVHMLRTAHVRRRYYSQKNPRGDPTKKNSKFFLSRGTPNCSNRKQPRMNASKEQKNFNFLILLGIYFQFFFILSREALEMFKRETSARTREKSPENIHFIEYPLDFKPEFIFPLQNVLIMYETIYQRRTRCTQSRNEALANSRSPTVRLIHVSNNMSGM